jgi:hypothetical protein
MQLKFLKITHLKKYFLKGTIINSQQDLVRIDYKKKNREINRKITFSNKKYYFKTLNNIFNLKTKKKAEKFKNLKILNQFVYVKRKRRIIFAQAVKRKKEKLSFQFNNNNLLMPKKMFK